MTKNEKIAALKLEFPTIKIGSDETGYTQLDADEYEATIAQWADVELAKDAKILADKQAVIDRTALLARLGITEEEAALLLGGTN
jgi:hypothetical protein